MVQKVPVRYVPERLSRKDRKKQVLMLNKSRKLYKSGKYYTRAKVQSFVSKESKHIKRARKIYNVDTIVPSAELSQATGCTIDALEKIVKKGEGAYYSSGSRPNQTAQSWGYARLASAITSGKSAAIDYNIIRDGCNHTKNNKAFVLANKSRRKYKYGQSHTRRVKM
jgi:hypothetical protein